MGSSTTGAAAAPALEQTGEKILNQREQKLASLREQYRNGTYQVNAPAVSAEIIEFHLRKRRQARQR